jgi:hypothetical protein
MERSGSLTVWNPSRKATFSKAERAAAFGGQARKSSLLEKSYGSLGDEA